MSELLSLWLPILLSAIVVFFASSMAWTVMPHHRKEHQPIPDEESFLKTIEAMSLEQGRYVFPYPGSPEETKSEDFQQKLKLGPTGVLTLYGRTNMGQNLVWTFVAFLAASAFLGYLASFGVPQGAGFLEVFRFVATAAIMTHCFGFIPNAIWFKAPILTNLLDGIVYGLLTGLVFALFWPG